MKYCCGAMAILAFASTAYAQPTQLPELAEVVSELSGREARANGFFRSSLGSPGPIFVTEGNYYQTELAVDRDTLRMIGECTDGSPFGINTDPKCSAEVEAELKLNGGNLILLVFKVTFPK